MKKIAVVGAGYVGLVTGACFSQKENQVIVIEKNQSKIKSLLTGKVPFYEPGLDELVLKAISENKIIFVETVSQALAYKPQIIFSCVGTPSASDGSADLSAVWNVAREVGRTLIDYCLFVNKSTVPVGTAKLVENIIKEELLERGISINFDVASNPEFLKEGDALNDFLMPDRVIIGVESIVARDILIELYKPFVANLNQILVMNRESAELSKYASNAMLATRISFMNQLALLADKVGADIAQVKIGMAKDRRIGSYFLNAGIGYGGSCFPKDVRALVHMGKEYDQPMTLVETVDKINCDQRNWFIDQILSAYNGNISGKSIGIWGLAFKPETDDIRYSPSIDVINILLENGAKIVVYDPVAWNNIKDIFEDRISFVHNSQEVLVCVDSLVILTEWQEFLKYQPQDFLALKDRLIFDGRNCFDPVSMKNYGISYLCVGRNKSGDNNQIDFEKNFIFTENIKKISNIL